MCGIALILSGVAIVGADPCRESTRVTSPDTKEIVQVCEPVVTVDDLHAALLRRGPDSLGSKKLFLSVEKNADEDNKRSPNVYSWESVKSWSPLSLRSATTSAHNLSINRMKSVAELDLLGATLQLRGGSPICQPLEDISGNLLAYNGEIFGGIHVTGDSNDAEALVYALQKCCSCCHGHKLTSSCITPEKKSVTEILSTIKGPWALIYWQEMSKTIWFGRDAFGRRSLLVHWPTIDDPRLVLSSVSPRSYSNKDSDSGVTHADCTPSYWEELPCGIYSIDLKASKTTDKCGEKKLVGEVRKHEWTDPALDKLIKWERASLDSNLDEISLHGLPSRKGQPHLRKLEEGYVQPAEKVLSALRESVMRRTTLGTIVQTALHQCEEMEPAPIGVLFSGGLDSMILAALLDQCLNSKYTIDLLNVSFDGHLAPDRISARTGVKELRRIAAFRRWRLVEIDADLSSLALETKHLMSLIHPAKTYMDLNIGLALWLAAGGDGWVEGDSCDHLEEGCMRYRYKSTARVLLVGSGADEQCAGYGRHRTKYRLGGCVALQEEMRLDMQRIWKRNLGRDDRCISDHGKEARFPFLDEDVIRTLLEIPLWKIADLDEPVGIGDKKILREVAQMLGLGSAAILPKRAIQFGSRIARESNRKNFGSNRAANQASAGSIEIYGANHQHHCS